MGLFTKLARDIFAPVSADGALRGAKLGEAQVWGTEVESVINAFLADGGLLFNTKAQIDASLDYPVFTMAWVLQDPVAANNGIYQKSAASGTGFWTRKADLPYSYIKLTDAGAGTPNAIQLTSSIPTSSSVMRVVTLYDPNTGDVTISENGGAAKQLLTSSGNQIAAGGLLGGMTIVYVDNGTNFRLLSDQASAAIQAAAEAAQVAAAASASEAATSALEAAGSATGLQRNAIPPQGRLTLVSGSPITASDEAGAAVIYYTPTGGNVIALYTGAGWAQVEFSEVALYLSNDVAHTGYHQSGKNFDLFAFNDSGTIRLGTGPAWSSDIARGTGAGTTELETVSGLATNKVAITLRFGSASGNTVSIAANKALYVGSFRAVANGQTSDTKTKRFLFNAYNQAMRPMIVRDPANNWTYSTLAWRQVNANTANKVEVLLGLAGTPVAAETTTIANSSPSGTWGIGGVGIDSTTELSPDCLAGWAVAGSSYSGSMSKYRGYPGLGYHAINYLEFAHGSGTSFLGDNSGNSIARPGLSAEVYA